ncbi:dihydrofolate reductase family protein [Saccharomonospora piscinae]|uniref:Deaminase n=1 Tax=Saccharomonospora piscinae TaxID=687388 RepID=A0A1V9A982_SACPI|nr:dihydrofolate reductase family protein [Saccharomonospora piscinae]OQO93641.1 deaminase [Saccharomonospora piscinae]TLW94802.1 deaminase [Saccharomonospora piscinae]
MGIVRWHTSMSFDGFVAGVDDAMDWVFEFTDPIPEVQEVIDSTGAILGGRRGYDVGRRPGQVPEARQPFGGAWQGPQFVLTHHPPEDEPDPSITFLSGDITAAVATALTAADGRDLLVLGADTGRQCVEHGLVDELLVHVLPTLLGAGVRLFESDRGRVRLQRIGLSSAGEITTLRYRLPRGTR